MKTPFYIEMDRNPRKMTDEEVKEYRRSLFDYPNLPLRELETRRKNLSSAIEWHKKNGSLIPRHQRLAIKALKDVEAELKKRGL